MSQDILDSMKSVFDKPRKCIVMKVCITLVSYYSI